MIDLHDLATGTPLDAATQERLEQQLLADSLRATAFGIEPETVSAIVQQRVELLRSLYGEVCQRCQSVVQRQTDSLDILWNLWLPLALHLASQRQAIARPFIQGLLGGQGSGKTTLGAVLTLILRRLGYQTLSLSLDDLYKTHSERLQLRAIDARLIWRGPPGTHDIDLGIRVLDGLRQPSGGAIAIPRFDKSLHHGSGDRIDPELVTGVDIVLFEGWFVGVRPIDAALFATAPAPISTPADRAFAHDMNVQLSHYQPLWDRLDSLIVLHPTDYRLSKTWRKQAEQQMRAKGKAGMSDADIDAFVDYFWTALHPELFIQPLLHNPAIVDLVVEIDANHVPTAVYSPAAC
jgi:D-glycerate 3-kinase